MKINEEQELMLPYIKPKPKKTRRYMALIIVGLLTAAYSVSEITISVKLDSIALLSDGIHNLSDVMSLIIAFWALMKSTTSRTDKMTYGWRRTEILGAVMNGCFLVALSLYIVLEAIPRIFLEPKALSTDWWFIGTAAAGLGVNTVGTILFSLLSGGHGHSHAGGGGHGHSHGKSEKKKKNHDHDDHGHSHKKKIKNENLKLPEPNPCISQVELSTDYDALARSFPADGSQSFTFPVDGNQNFQKSQQQPRDHDHHDEDDHPHHDLKNEKKNKKHQHDEDDHPHHDHKHEKKNKKEGEDHHHKDLNKEKNKKHDHNGHHHGHEEEDDHRKEKKHKKEKIKKDLNIHAVFLHYLGDALSSIFVLTAGLLGKYFAGQTWTLYLDPVSSLLIVGLILATTIPLLKNCCEILLQQTPSQIHLPDLKQAILKVSGIKGVHDLHVWQLVDNMIIASLHVIVFDSDVLKFGKISTKVKKIFHKFGIHSTTLQPEFVHNESNVDDCDQNCIKDCAEDWCCKEENLKTVVDLAASYDTFQQPT